MKPTLKLNLDGEDGNVFAIVGLVSKTLLDAGQRDKALEFRKNVFHQGSYTKVLQYASNFVDIEAG